MNFNKIQLFNKLTNKDDKIIIQDINNYGIKCLHSYDKTKYIAKQHTTLTKYFGYIFEIFVDPTIYVKTQKTIYNTIDENMIDYNNLQKYNITKNIMLYFKNDIKIHSYPIFKKCCLSKTCVNQLVINKSDIDELCLKIYVNEIMNNINYVDVNEIINHDDDGNENENKTVNCVVNNELTNNELVSNELTNNELVSNELTNNELTNNESKTKTKTTRKYVKKTIPPAMKKKVWNRWIGETVGQAKCMCCKTFDIYVGSFSCGHIIAEYHGGTISVENLRPICNSCNSSMGTKNMNDYIAEFNF